ncbi:MAG: hypothetical protein GY839_04155 [candidate division Zixibacteria bacterium]|nr:hypothetical protein [candidate division Zixibacteria bacterium]
MRILRFFITIVIHLINGRISYALSEIAKRAPYWLFRYHKAHLMYTDSYRFSSNINPEARIRIADKTDIDDIIRISGLDQEKVFSLLDSGAFCFLASLGDSPPSSISWNASGLCFIRGMGFEYDFGSNGSYGFWAVTLPGARGKGLHNALIAAKARYFIEHGAEKFFSIIEFDNILSYDIRVKAGQQPLLIIYHARIFNKGITYTINLINKNRTLKFVSLKPIGEAIII